MYQTCSNDDDAPVHTMTLFDDAHTLEQAMQGRGKNEEGADMVSRITLATMYRAARLAGVPLKLEDAPEAVKRSFLVDTGLIQAARQGYP